MSDQPRGQPHQPASADVKPSDPVRDKSGKNNIPTGVTEHDATGTPNNDRKQTETAGKNA